ncbi:MAG: sensor histidine kinase, partial [Verrucomicrobiota bacterium]|nr:sensor histidine kinase [Verrucomicrobiota bacterium]
AHLQQAYELGRVALNREMGVFDMVRLHQEAMVRLIASTEAAVTTAKSAEAVQTFLLETLSPFEAAHRGFRDAWERLRQLNRTLEQRNKELATTNEKLRISKQHFVQLFQEARTMEENLRLLSNKVLSAQEEERKHISRELHDEIGQALTAVNVSLALLQKQNGSAQSWRKKVGETRALLESSMESVHRFARELRPEMLDHLGLYASLRSYVKNFAARTGIKAALRTETEIEHLTGQQEIVLFRVAQESLTNIAKHARATQAEIVFSRTAKGLCMEVKDNGRSFAVEEQLAVKRHKRLGLLGMQERVRLVNGEFAIESAPNCGTTVRITIPLAKNVRPKNAQPQTAA